MPIHACTLEGGGSGFQWGSKGKCFPHREQAERQAAAARANGYAGDCTFDPGPPGMAADSSPPAPLRRQGRTVVGRAVRPNLGVGAAYRDALLELVRDMQDSLEYWISHAYAGEELPGAALREPGPELSQDAKPTPARRLDKLMREMAERWQREFDDAAPKLAGRFALRAGEGADQQLRRVLRQAGVTVKFKPSRAVRDAFDATVAENVGLIKSIASEHLADVQGLVMRSVAAGRDLGPLVEELQQRYDLTRKRAALIARDQNNKATATMGATRRLQLGLVEAQWEHSGAGKHPRKSHVKAGKQGLRFDVRKGAYIDGEYIQPGELINCRCTSRPVIPGLDDDD